MRKFLFILIINCLLIINSQTQWVKQTLPISRPVVGIEFTDSLKGWSCTSRGASNFISFIMHTTNGGTNWFVQHDSVAYNFYAMDMVTDSVGYVVGSSSVNVNGLVLKTTNCGLNWVNLDINVGLIIEDVFFPSKDTGYICSSNSFGPGIWFTSNGGANWQTRNAGTNIFRQCLFFINNNTGWCGTLGQILYKTTNAGLNWINNGNFPNGNGVYSIYFLNESTGWVGLVQGPSVAKTTNGGTNWIFQNTPFTGIISDLYFHNENKGWAGINFQVINKTTNGGNNWGYQIDSSGSYRISFVDSLIGWSGGEQGITKTTNSGGVIIYLGFINTSNEIPVDFILHQNYPNPFNPATTINLDVPKSSEVNLVICDMLGRELYTIANQFLKTGSYSFTWDARNYSSGIYFYRLTAGSFLQTRKMVLIK